MSWLEAIRARLRLLFAPGAAESRMDEEIRFHVEMETDRLIRAEGLDRREARRRALVSFGGVEKTKEELREGRGLGWLSGLRLDLKLGGRMLLKYPVLTGASVLALTIAVALAASWFTFMTNITHPQLPLPDADRLVMVRTQNLSAAGNQPASLHDYESWRSQVTSIDDLSAASWTEYVVTTEDGRIAALEGMRVTPAALRLTRVRPQLGRVLSERDFDGGAAPVVVLGHGAWQRLFDGSASAIGQSVRLGAEHATVVGVMPEGFGFPVNQEVWSPLRERAVDYPVGEGPQLMTFGRLSPGATLEEARSELALIGGRAAAEHPETHELIRPKVNRFARGSDMSVPARLFNLPFLLFLIVVSANIATLLFARTATREGEIALRSALGASRRRIILQLVAEAMVLTTLAAALGLSVAHWGLGWGMDLFWQVQQEQPPFWFRSGIAPSSVLYVLGLAALAAIVIGGIPGLRATRRQLRNRLPQAGAGGAGVRFGVFATGVIVLQVALCVAFIPMAILRGEDLLTDRAATTFPAEDYLSGRLMLDSGLRGDAQTTPDGDRESGSSASGLLDEVHRRLSAEPGVIAVTRASLLPGINHPPEALEIEGDSATLVGARHVAVDPNFFEVMDARVVSGRGFRQNDVTATDPVAIVDQGWAAEAFGGQNPVGRRIRYPMRDGEDGERWYEIVGLVAGMDRAVGPGEPIAVLHPLRPERHGSVRIYLRTVGRPAALAPQVASLVTSVDPRVAVVDLLPLEEVWRPVERSQVFFVVALSVVAAIILLFALIGIYALMSFTVARRTREIGIRAALGADPRRIVTSIFSRALGQIGLGIVVGAALVSLTVVDSPEGIRLVAGVAAAMAVVGLLGCVIPVARALRIQPTDALRAE